MTGKNIKFAKGREVDLAPLIRSWAARENLVALNLEPGFGASLGVPDFCLTGAGRPIWIELKIGEIVNGELRYTVRPAQRKLWRRLIAAGSLLGLVIGVSGTDFLVVKPLTVDPGFGPVGGRRSAPITGEKTNENGIGQINWFYGKIPVIGADFYSLNSGNDKTGYLTFREKLGSSSGNGTQPFSAKKETGNKTGYY